MRRALLVIDVQNEYFTGVLPVTYPEGSLGNILKAMDTALGSGVPVVVIRHTSTQPGAKAFVRNTPGWELHEEVRRRVHDLLVEKKFPGSLTGTGLEEWLRKEEVDTVAVCGYMTQMCCDTTARQAFHAGFSVEFLSDATGTLSIKNDAGSVKDEELHRAILVTQAMRFSKVLTAADWIRNISAVV